MSKISMGKSLCVIVDGTACFISPVARPLCIELLEGESAAKVDEGRVVEVIFHLDRDSTLPARITDYPLMQEITEKARELVTLLTKGEEK